MMAKWLAVALCCSLQRCDSWTLFKFTLLMYKYCCSVIHYSQVFQTEILMHMNCFHAEILLEFCLIQRFSNSWSLLILMKKIY